MNNDNQTSMITQIEDTGKGIEEERIKYLFIPFGDLRNK